MILEVLEARLAAVTDLGRRRAHQGLATGGARDQDAARAANALVGNAADAPLAELLLHAAAVRFDADALVAVTGAAAGATVDGVAAETSRPVVVPAGATLRVGPAASGTVSYLAVAGSWTVPRLAGSAAPDAALDVGTALEPGVRIAIERPPGHLVNPVLGVPLLDVRTARSAAVGPVPLLPGPDLDDALRHLLPELDLGVDGRSDHVGVRLTGAVPAAPDTAPLLSQGVPVGAVELPAAGELIVLQRGRVLTAGYPIVGVVPVVDQWRIAQLRPGDRLRFAWTTPEDAVGRLRARRTGLDRVHDRVRAALRALADQQDLADAP